jgi:cytochrome P450
LYRLLANPEYIEPLREEVEAVVAQEGWTKAGMDKMHKIDSFLRETQRMDGLTLRSLYILPDTSSTDARHCVLVVMTRLALRPFTFSNGVTIPAGTLIAIPASAAHRDEETFRNPEEFDGFRFSNLRERDGDDAVTTRHQVISTSAEHLSFGLGRHTW